MFDSLQENLSSAFRSLAGRGKLTEANMREGLEQVQTALLEADVSFKVVREFMQRITEQAVGERVLKSLKPNEMVMGIVHQELIRLMGETDSELNLHSGLNILMLCGLQGSGKTTTCAKLARLLKKRSVKPMLAAADLQRPAAIEQLRVLGEQIGVPVYTDFDSKDPVKVCRAAVTEAKSKDVDVLILDTAGRLAIDQELMTELSNIDKQVEPDQVYLVVDGMTGQDAVNSAQGFNDALELNGVIMTKLDGDARGGAILSVREVTGVPVKFIGTGEKIDELDDFSPERMAGRILGQGDIVGLFKKAQEEFDQEEAVRAEERLRKGEFTLDDFRKQMSQVTKLGPMQKVMGMLGLDGGMQEMLDGVDTEKDMRRMFGIIDSMTPEEKRNPKQAIDQSRRRRIAEGAGVAPSEVKGLIEQYDTLASVMKQMSGMGMRDRMRMARQMQTDAMANPAGQLAKKKQGTGKRLSPKEKARLKKQRAKERRRAKRK
ncbi:MAG: signal recognition particle protein [Planctomycetota bacterium]|nr:MAG: signal recognition particle protein [Planctomycetota bacterium]REJ90285.1 MAG: signal recognition particle protein [Planctomycetota bacterium]REK17796.1 MAG: signal recognition particle protein [Planctomycetota bacterium]REK40974.1 MAG: signal recognition particle protein [Planctomycetota bacterium]